MSDSLDWPHYRKHQGVLLKHCFVYVFVIYNLTGITIIYQGYIIEFPKVSKWKDRSREKVLNPTGLRHSWGPNSGSVWWHVYTHVPTVVFKFVRGNSALWHPGLCLCLLVSEEENGRDCAFYVWWRRPTTQVCDAAVKKHNTTSWEFSGWITKDAERKGKPPSAFL